MYNEIANNKRKSVLLLLLFFIFIIAIGWWASWYFEAGSLPLFIAVIVATGMSAVSYYHGDTLALTAARAKPLEANDNPYVWRLVENLCIANGTPMPKVYLINDPALNAFATGRDPQHASLALTTGLVQALENEELEGVIAHELSHIRNYDTRYMMVVIVCVGVIALLSDFTLRSFFWRGRGRSERGNNATAVLLLIGLILAVLSPIVSKLIQLAISRKREFLADASGALLTRYPEGLARALEKIAASPDKLRQANHATAHLYINDPFTSRLGKLSTALFSTHPPITERINRLRHMA